MKFEIGQKVWVSKGVFTGAQVTIVNVFHVDVPETYEVKGLSNLCLFDADELSDTYISGDL